MVDVGVVDVVAVGAAVVVLAVVVGAWVVDAVVVEAWVVAGAVVDEEEAAVVKVVEVGGSAGEVGPLDAQADANRVAARTAVRRTVETVGLPAGRRGKKVDRWFVKFRKGTA